MKMLKITLMLFMTCFWCSHSIASDFDGFISEGNSYGYSSFWNWKSTAEGGWEYIASWMNDDGEVVWEAQFDTVGSKTFDDPIPHVPFHDWAGEHGLSVGTGNWSHPCGVLQVCDGGGGSWDPL